MKWNKAIVWVVFGLLFIACRERATLMIPEEKMIAVMTDMFMAEAAMQRLTKQVKDTLSITYYQQIYEIHGLSETEYLANLKIMERNPPLAKKIYDSVMEKISTLENED